MSSLLFLVLLSLTAYAQPVHEICQNCHNDKLEDLKAHKHFSKNLSCDACHGESSQHSNSNGAVAPDRVSAAHDIPKLCGGCHSKQGGEYLESKHAKVVLAKGKARAAQCATCHGHHRQRTAAHTLLQCKRCHASLPASHPQPAGGDKCWTCHSPHTLLVAKK
ncbi:MAG: hypothetical protein ACKV22_33750 [Bryobacteraceae bacterium]